MTFVPTYYGAQEVESVLTWRVVNRCVEEALVAVVHVNAGQSDSCRSFACQPPRVFCSAGRNRDGLFAMPGYVANHQLPMDTEAAPLSNYTLACKLVTSFDGNEHRQPPLPNIMANILLFSPETGQLEAIVDGTRITAWRTAAASIVATKHLYFRPRRTDETDAPIDVAIIGCGIQGESHALGMCATFNVRNVYLWNRTAAKATALAERLRKIYRQVAVHVTESAALAVANVDVVCVGTFASTALIDLAMLGNRVAHINTVGAGQVHFGEVAQDIYDKADVYVDCWASAQTELQGLQAHIVAEVGEVILNGICPSKGKLTIFQSMGIAAEDATVAQAVLNLLRSKPTSKQHD